MRSDSILFGISDFIRTGSFPRFIITPLTLVGFSELKSCIASSKLPSLTKTALIPSEKIRLELPKSLRMASLPDKKSRDGILVVKVSICFR